MCALACLIANMPTVLLNMDKSVISAVIVIKIIYLAPMYFPLFLRFIRCWDAKYGHEIYRITVGLGGSGSGPDLCVWSLLSLR